jgi:hypothetical protein
MFAIFYRDNLYFFQRNRGRHPRMYTLSSLAVRAAAQSQKAMNRR